MNFKNLFRIAAFIGLPSLLVQAQNVEQDTLSHLYKIGQQYNNERDFKSNLYYNPSPMADYSSSTFTSVQIGYTNEDNKTFRKPLGQKSTTYGLTTTSYQKVNDRVSLWGNASYTTRKTNKMQWNENLDFDRISPYSVSDSVISNIEVEKYNFLGGYAQKVNRFTIGLQGEYTAQLGARSRDPRNKTITSDLTVKFGTNYHFYKDYEVGAYIQGEKYTQNNQIRFASLLGYPILYQMTSFGNYNYMFSGGSSSNSTLYEQFGYEYGGYVMNKEGKDLYILARQGNQDLVKSTNGIFSSQYDISELKDEFTIIEGAKFFNKDNHRFGIKAQYGYKKRIGTEYGYSNNTSVLELIYKQKSYKREITNYSAELFYQLTKSKYILTIIPSVNYEDYDERRLRPVNGQKWNSLTFGITADAKVEIAKDHILTVQPYFLKKTVNDQLYLFDSNQKNDIKNWVINDYNYLSSDVTSYGTTLRYDFKLNRLPGLFASFNWQNNQILNQNNTYTSLQLGVVF